MGLFSGSRKVYVSSVIYNMAGDQDKRPDYMKSAIVSNVIADTNFSMSDMLSQSYLKGPGIKLRRFFNWIQSYDNYDNIGRPTDNLVGSVRLNIEELTDHIPHDPDQQVRIQKAEVDLADYGYWVDQWILANNPSILEDDYETDFDDATGEVVIMLSDSTEIRFEPVGFVPTASYIYASYNLSNGAETGVYETGTTVTLGDGDSFPSTSGWSLTSDETEDKNTTLTKTVRVVSVYSDGRPNDDTTTTTTDNVDWEERDRTYERTTYGEGSGSADELTSLAEWMFFHESKVVDETETSEVVVETVPVGVTKTTTTTTTQEVLKDYRTYRTDEQETVLKSWSGLKQFIYRIGSGNAALDALVIREANISSQYFPFIPVRIDNKYITELPYPDAIAEATKAYKKLTGEKLSELIERVDDNPDIDDIDFTYVAFGVSANVKEVACLEYLFRFFSNLMATQVTDDGDQNSWDVAMDIYEVAMANWNQWKEAQADESDPLFGSPEPTVPVYPSVPTNKVRIAANGDFENYFDMQITWSTIVKTSGSGLKKPDAKMGELWWEAGSDIEKVDQFYVNKSVGFIQRQVLLNVYRLHYQKTNGYWETLEIRGMVHRNYIYEGKYVEITLKEAVEDVEESGFLVPLHYPTFKSMSLVDSTQMSTACMFLVFNCYQVVKQAWYQTGIFKIILVVIVIAIIVVTQGTGASSVGLLGSNLAVGTAIGLTGVAAIIAGAVANALAGLIVATIIQKGSTAIFGEKFGAIIGAIAAYVALNVGTQFMNGGSLSMNWGSMLSAGNLVQLTSAIGEGLSQYMLASAKEYGVKTQEVIEDYKQATKEIADLFAENIGYGRGLIDPTILTEVGIPTVESPRTFLDRTLMTGTDIAELSLSMLERFAQVTSKSELPV